MRQSNNTLLIIVLVVAAAAGGLWYYWQGLSQPSAEPTITSAEDPNTDSPPRVGPIHPLELSEPSSEERQLVPLPALDDLDSYLRLELVGIFGDALDELLARETLINRFVATVDNLPRSHVAERIRPVGGISGTFTVDRNSDDDALVLSPANFERYTFLIEMIPEWVLQRPVNRGHRSPGRDANGGTTDQARTATRALRICGCRTGVPVQWTETPAQNGQRAR